MKHPMRYPIHDGDKGTVYDGTCNRSACGSNHAVWYNRNTYAYYCFSDARGINECPDIYGPLCTRVDHDLTIEEMDARHNRMT